MTNIAPATPGRHFRLNLLLLAVVGVSLLGLAACSEDKATVNFPRTPAEESQKWLFDVTGNSASDIYVAGNIGAMFHFDGATWTAQDMGTTAAITTLWTSPLPGENTVYAAGHGGRIWRNTGSAWSSMTSGTQANLYGLGMFANQLHAVGANGAIRRAPRPTTRRSPPPWPTSPRTSPGTSWASAIRTICSRPSPAAATCSTASRPPATPGTVPPGRARRARST